MVIMELYEEGVSWGRSKRAEKARQRGMYVYLSGSGVDGRVIGVNETARITEVVKRY